FRSTLWQWRSGVSAVELARTTYAACMPHVDCLFCSLADLPTFFSIPLMDAPTRGNFVDVGRRAVEDLLGRFPNLSWIVISYRHPHSAIRHEWGGAVYS